MSCVSWHHFSVTNSSRSDSGLATPMCSKCRGDGHREEQPHEDADACSTAIALALCQLLLVNLRRARALFFVKLRGAHMLSLPYFLQPGKVPLQHALLPGE